MNSRQRVRMALDHQEPDRLPIDLGSTLVTSICLKPYQVLMDRLGFQLKETRLIDYVQQLPFLDKRLLERFEVDLRMVQLPAITAQGVNMFEEGNQDDESKLAIRWPLTMTAGIYHDIPFGVVETCQDRPFFPTSWVDFCDGRRGLAFYQVGVHKHWVSENMLGKLLAWGEDTDAIHNGLGRDRWLKSFDQRLNGSHQIEGALFIHPGDWRSGGVVQAALAYSNPPVAALTGSHAGPLPAQVDILHFEEPGLIATSVFTRDEQVVCRVYSTGQQAAEGRSHQDRLRQEYFRSITGEAVSRLSSFQIGELVFRRASQKE